MSKPPLSAVLFDIDDTLYSTTAFARRARENSIAAMIRHGLRIDPARCYEELVEVIAEFSSNYEHHYEKLLSRLPASSWKGVNPAVLVSAAVVAYHQTKSRELKPYPDVIPVLKALARRRLLLGVVTSGLAVKQAEKLIRLGVIGLLDPRAIFISEQIGISKPNPKLYLTACRRLGLSPQAALYVGDDPRMDVDPPNRIGMRTARIRRGGKHDTDSGATAPAHEIKDLRELWDVVRTGYRVTAPRLP